MTRLELNQLMKMLRQTPAMQSKINIGRAIQVNAAQAKNLQNFYALPGDDTAAIPTDQGYLLHACEGMIPSFVEQYPYFAGWSAVMANVSDIAAMGGRATSIVNSFWHTHADKAHKKPEGSGGGRHGLERRIQHDRLPPQVQRIAPAQFTVAAEGNVGGQVCSIAFFL